MFIIGSIIFPVYIYNNKSIYPLILILYIWLYNNIVKEIGHRKNEPQGPNKYFNKYIGPFIQKNYESFFYYFSIKTPLEDFFKFDEENKLIYKNRKEKNVFSFIIITAALFYSIFYIISLTLFVMTNPVIRTLVTDFIVSILELKITTAQAMENDDNDPIKILEKKLYKNVVPPIHPLIVIGIIGSTVVSLTKKNHFISAFKKINSENKWEAATELGKLISSYTQESLKVGFFSTAVITGMAYYYLHNQDLLESITSVRYNNITEPVNEYTIYNNAIKTFPELISTIQNAQSIEHLERASDLFQQFPEKIREKNNRLYENEMFKARCRIKQ